MVASSAVVSNKNKRAAWAKAPQDQKHTVLPPLGDSNQLRAVWNVGILDLAGPDFGVPYGFQAMSASELQGLLTHLRMLESMTWAEIIRSKKKNHLVPVSNLCSEAQRRLEELGQDDCGELQSLGQMGSLPRIWGIRLHNILKVLWWDPEHRICPSLKKYT